MLTGTHQSSKQKCNGPSTSSTKVAPVRKIAEMSSAAADEEDVSVAQVVSDKAVPT